MIWVDVVPEARLPEAGELGTHVLSRSPLISHWIPTVTGDAVNVPLATAVVPMAVPFVIAGLDGVAIVTVPEPVPVHPWESVTVTEYVPAAETVMLWLVELLLQR